VAAGFVPTEGENQTGSATMQTAVKSSFILTEIFSFPGLAGSPATKYEALYQQIVSGLCKQVASKETIHRLAQQLAELAHNAYNLRQLDTVKQASQMLVTFPEPWKHMGSYYQAKCLRHEGRIAEARTILEHVAERAPLRYRARAVQFLGAIYHTTGQYQDALPLYAEASRMAKSNWCDPHTIVTASQNIAILKSIDGDHRGALAGLENIFPLVQALGRIEPYKYHHYLNSFSVELIEVGRFEEANDICKIVLASPFINAYPEWRETATDAEVRGHRSRLFFQSTKPQNLLHFPAPPQDSGPAESLLTEAEQPVRILSYLDWIKKMVKEPNGDQKDEKIPGKLSDRQMIMKIVDLATTDDLPDEALQKMLDSLTEIVEEYTKKKG
jgi:tetratricopeptide (TPR) repeat protein